MGFVQDISSLRELQADALHQGRTQPPDHRQQPRLHQGAGPAGPRAADDSCSGCHLVEVDDFEQVRGSDWTQWWKGESETLARQAVASAQRGETARFEAFGETFKGTPKWWDTVVSPIHDNKGQPVMLLAVSRDITEQHRQQDHIRRLNNDLEQRVRRNAPRNWPRPRIALRQALSDAQALYNQAPCGYHSVDAKGSVRADQPAPSSTGWVTTREEVVGRLHFRDCHVAARHVEQAVERLQPPGGEGEARRRHRS